MGFNYSGRRSLATAHGLPSDKRSEGQAPVGAPKVGKPLATRLSLAESGGSQPHQGARASGPAGSKSFAVTLSTQREASSEEVHVPPEQLAARARPPRQACDHSGLHCDPVTWSKLGSGGTRVLLSVSRWTVHFISEDNTAFRARPKPNSKLFASHEKRRRNPDSLISSAFPRCKSAARRPNPRGT